MHVHDVVIVGAGPGGAATAYFLSRQGADVLLVDRAEFPREKTCGDGLTPLALRVLDRMGILSDVRARGCEVGAYEVVAPNGRATSATIDPGALVVPRVVLDHLIVDRAISAGAAFQKRTVSRVEPTAKGVQVYSDNGQTVHGRIAVIATGAATGVLKRSGMLKKQQPRAMLAARAYFDGLQDEVARTFQLRFDGAPMPGYGWVFPVGARAANIGVGFLPSRHSRTVAQAFEQFVVGRAVAALVRGARQFGPLKGYPIRVDFLRAPTFAQNCLLVGEAAGLVNPLTGEGIDYALESGMIAAEHVIRGLDSDVDNVWLTQYDRLLRDRFEKVFRFSEWIRDWYCKPPLLNALVPLANRRPELRQLLASIVLGEREPRGDGPAKMAVRLLVYLARHL